MSHRGDDDGLRARARGCVRARDCVRVRVRARARGCNVCDYLRDDDVSNTLYRYYVTYNLLFFRGFW